MFRRSLLTFGLFFALIPTASYAWWDMGHMEVAARAYTLLDPAVRTKVDALIKLNPDYQKWITNVPAAEQPKVAFAHAATWADDIKKQNSGYKRDDVTAPTAADNKGYTDKIQHDYWHYVDIPFTTDGSFVEPPPVPNALTQMRVLSDALADPATPDDIRSFDLVWLLHLIGDIHQPLHATARVTRYLQDDRGGNDQTISVDGGSPVKLHAYWDSQFGDGADPAAAITAADKLPDAPAAPAAIPDPGMWLIESFALAQNVVYTPAIGDDDISVYALPKGYGDRAAKVSKAQAALAAARLANLINTALK